MKIENFNSDILLDSVMSSMTQSYSIHFKKISGDKYIEYDFYGNKDVYSNDISMDNVTIRKDGKFLYYINNSSNAVNINLTFEKEYSICGELGEIVSVMRQNKNLKILASYSQRDGKNIQGVEYIDKLTNTEYFYLYVGSILDVEVIDIEEDTYISSMNLTKKFENPNKNDIYNDEIHIVDERNPNKILQIIKNNKRYFPTNRVISKKDKYENFVSVATQNPFLKYKQTFESLDGEYLNIYEDLYDENVDKTSKNLVQKTKKYKTKRKNIPILGSPKGWRRRWNVVRRFVSNRVTEVKNVAVKVKDVAVEVYKNPIESAKSVARAVKAAALAAAEKAKEEATRLTEGIKKFSRTVTAKIKRNKLFDQLSLPSWTKVAYYRIDSLLDEDGQSIKDKYGEREGGVYIILDKMTPEEISQVGGIQTMVDGRYQLGDCIATDETYETNFYGFTNHNGAKVIELLPVSEMPTKIELLPVTKTVEDVGRFIVNLPSIAYNFVFASNNNVGGGKVSVYSYFQNAKYEKYFNKLNLNFSGKSLIDRIFVPSLKGLNVKQTPDGKLDSSPVVISEDIEKTGKISGDTNTWWDNVKAFFNRFFYVFLVIFAAAAVIGISWRTQEARDAYNTLGVPYYRQCKYCYCNQEEINGDLCNTDYTPKFNEGESELYSSEPCLTTVEEDCEKTEDGKDRFLDEEGNALPDRTKLLEACFYCRRCMLDIDDCDIMQTTSRMPLGEWFNYVLEEFNNSPTRMKVYWGIYLVSTFCIIPMGIAAALAKAGLSGWTLFGTSLFAEMLLMWAAEGTPFNLYGTPANYFIKDEGERCRKARQCRNGSKVCYENRYYQVSPFCLQNYSHCSAGEKRYLYQQLEELDGANQIDKVLNYPQITDISGTKSQAMILSSLRNGCEIFAGYDNDIYKFDSEDDIQLIPGGYKGNIYNIHFDSKTTVNQLDFIIEVVSSTKMKDVVYENNSGLGLFEISHTGNDGDSLDDIAKSLDNQLNAKYEGYNREVVSNYEIVEQYLPSGYIKDEGKWLDNYIGRTQRRKDNNSFVGRTLQYKVTLDTTLMTDNPAKGQITIKVPDGSIKVPNLDYEREENAGNDKTNVESDAFVLNIDLSTGSSTEGTTATFDFKGTIILKESEDDADDSGEEMKWKYGDATVENIGLYTSNISGKLILTKQTDATYTIASFPTYEIDYTEGNDIVIVVKEKTKFGILEYASGNSKTNVSTDETSLSVWGDTKFYEIASANSEITGIKLNSQGKFYLTTTESEEDDVTVYESEIDLNVRENVVDPYYSDILLVSTDRGTRSLENRCQWLYTNQAKIGFVAAISKANAFSGADKTRDDHVKNVLSRIDEYKDYKNNFIFENDTTIDTEDLAKITASNNTLRYKIGENVFQPGESGFLQYETDSYITDNSEEARAFINTQARLFYDSNSQQYIEYDGDNECDLWKKSNQMYIPIDVPDVMIAETYNNIYIGPTEDSPGVTVNPKLLTDNDYIIVEKYSTTGVSIRKKTYEKNLDDEGNVINTRNGPESISDSEVRGVQSALFSIDLPNYYYDEVIKGNWRFGNKIVIDTTDERAYYRDTIGANEKIILLTDQSYKYTYPTNTVVEGNIDRDGEEIFVQTSITAPFTYALTDSSTNECRIIKVRRVTSEGNPVEKGWDTGLRIQGIFYYPTLSNESEGDDQTIYQKLTTCESGGSETTIGSINTINEKKDTNGQYKFHTVTFKKTDNQPYLNNLTSKDSNISLVELVTSTETVENTTTETVENTTTETDDDVTEVVEEVVCEQLSIGIDPTSDLNFSINDNSNKFPNYFTVKIFINPSPGGTRKFKFTYNDEGENIYYVDTEGTKHYNSDPKDIEFVLSFSSTDEDVSSNSNLPPTSTILFTTSTVESPNIAAQGEQEGGSYFGSFVSVGEVVGTIKNTMAIYQTLSKLIYTPRTVGQRIDSYGKLFGSSKRMKSINLYSENNIDIDTRDLVYEFYGYLKMPATIIQFRIDIQEGDYALFYINDSYIIDSGFYGGTAFKEKKVTGNTVSLISHIQNYNEMVTMVQYKLYFVKQASNSKGIKILWRYTNNEENIETKQFEVISTKSFRLNDVGYEYVYVSSNSEKLQGLLYNIYDLQIIDNAYFKGDILAKNKETLISGEFNYNKDFFRKEKPSHSEIIEVGSSNVFQKGVYLPYPHMKVEIDESSLTTGKPIIHWVNSWDNCGGIPKDNIQTFDNYDNFTVGKSVAQWGCQNYRSNMQVINITVPVPSANSFNNPPTTVGAGGVFIVEHDTKNNFSLEVDNYKLIVSNNYGFTGKWDYDLLVKASIEAGDNLYAHFVGYLKSPISTDSLKFKVVSDDGVIFSFDGKELVNDWSMHGSRPNETGNLTVNEDYYYLFDVQYFQGRGGAELYIQWNINNDGEIFDGWNMIKNDNFWYISGMNDLNLQIGRESQSESLRKSVAKGGKLKEGKKAPYLQGYFVTSYELDRLGGGNRGSPKNLIEPTKLIVNKNINYYWGSGSVFGVRKNNIYNVIEGYIHIPHRDTFKLATQSDDGIRLFFDNELVVDDWSDHGARLRESKNLRKSEGKYPFRIEHYEAGGGAAMELLWRKSGEKFAAIPSKYFYVKNDLSAIQFFNQGKNAIKKYKITVGSSRKNVKTVNLSLDNLIVSATPLNRQDPRWSDSFSTSVTGKTLTVTRTDSKSGWGQNLILEAITQTDQDAEKRLININNKSNYTQGTNVNVYELYRNTKTGERLRWTLMGKTSIRQEINFNWNSRTDVKINGIGRRDNVYMEMFGVLKIPEKINGVKRNDLQVRFEIGSDDGSRLFFDDKLIIDNWKDQGYRRKTSGYTKVTPGSYHPFKVEYYEAGGGARLTLKWNITQTGFNWREYTSMYPDVKNGWTEYPFKEHFQKHGKKEGRLSGDMAIIPKENFFRLDNNKLTLDNIHKEAISEVGEFEIISDTWTRPVLNSILDVGKFKNIFTFKMSFEIRPLGTRPAWSNILTMKLANANYGVQGARWPGIWFYANTTRLHIVCGGNSKDRYNAKIDPREHLTLNKIHRVTIERNRTLFKVFLQIQNEDNSYQDTREYSKICDGLDNSFINRINDLKFFFSDKHHLEADCEVKNLRIEML